MSDKSPLSKQFFGSLVGLAVISALGLFLFNQSVTPTVAESQVPNQIEDNHPSASIGEAQPVRFLALGDSGSGASFQRDVAQQMLAMHQKTPVQLAIHMGDVIYPHWQGRDYADKRYKTFYQPLMDSGVPFRISIGNHDVHKGYDPDMLDYYGMPARYYTFDEGAVSFVCIDTNIMDDATQLTWLRQTLNELKERPAPHWTVVYGHHPILTTGRHAGELGYMSTLADILASGDVDLYLAGHDHNYERFEPVNGVTYIVSGGGGAYLRDFKIPPHEKTAVRKSTHHFLEGEVQGNQLTLTAIDKTGEVFDSVVLSK